MTHAFFGRHQVSKVASCLPTTAQSKMDKYQRDWDAFNMSIVDTSARDGRQCAVASIFAGVQPNGTMSKVEVGRRHDLAKSTV